MKKKFLTLISIVTIGLCFVGCNNTSNSEVTNTPTSNVVNTEKENSNTEKVDTETKSEDTNNTNDTSDNNETSNTESTITFTPDINLSEEENIEKFKDEFLKIPDENDINVNENGNIVEITVKSPAGIKISEENIEKEAKENGYISYKINDNGTITYTMTKETRDNTLKKYKQEMDDSINELLNGEDKNVSFTDINYNDNLSEFNIYCDSNKYTEFDKIFASSIEILGYYYQAFSGVKPNDISINVHFKDKDTKNIIYTDVYPK